MLTSLLDNAEKLQNHEINIVSAISKKPIKQVGIVYINDTNLWAGWKTRAIDCPLHRKDKMAWMDGADHSKRYDGTFDRQHIPGQLMTWSRIKRGMGVHG